MEKEFKQFLRESNIPEEDQLTIKFLAEAIEKNEINEFVSKTFLFQGDPGIGKTYFVENLMKHLNLPIIFMGPFKFEHNKSIQCKNLKEMSEKVSNVKEAVVFIDDLQNTFKMQYDGCGEMRVLDSERKLFLSMLENIKRANEKKFLFMTLNDGSVLEESWLDRIETKIELDVPKEKSKKLFLTSKYSKYLKKPSLNEIVDRSMGYNFRNLDELIKIAYREGNGAINKNSIRKALSVYSPTVLGDYDIIHKVGLSFREVIGNEKLKKDLLFLKQYVKHPRLFNKNGIERSNVLIFSGPPGTGKTYMAKALAGELDLPLINVDARTLLGRGGALFGPARIINLARRFKNCILFIDEFDKLLGREMFSEDGNIMGNFEGELDGIKEKTKAIIILAMNNKLRFGSAFHDRIPCFDFGYPLKNEREEFIAEKVKKSKVGFLQNHIDYIVKETENVSYRQIEKIWNNILFKLIEREDTLIKNNKIIANAQSIEESIGEVLSLVPNKKPASSMFG